MIRLITGLFITIAASRAVFAQSCIDPDLGDLDAGVKVMLCDGSIGVGTGASDEIADCTKDGQVNCKAKAAIPAIEASTIAVDKISTGASLGGKVGTKQPSKICRSAAQLATLDLHSTPTRLPLWIGFGAVNTGTEEFTFAGHQLVNDLPVRLQAFYGALPAPLALATTYYVKVTSSSTFQLSATPGGAAIDLTSQGTQNFNFVSPNGVADIFDVIDDFNNWGPLSPPSEGPWGASYVCNGSNFTNVTGGTGLVPDNALATAAGANQAWTQIWQDDLTGLYFTNALHNGVTWAVAMRICHGINGSTAGSGWYLPTAKEFLQSSINGSQGVNESTGLFSTGYFWTSTQDTIADAITIGNGGGPSGYPALKSASFNVMCVREP